MKQNSPVWFKPRRYKHFDVPVGVAWAKTITPKTVSTHSWSPLLHYTKKTRRYKKLASTEAEAAGANAPNRKIQSKPREIMYASHRDSAILAKYSDALVSMLDKEYSNSGLHDAVIAYRSLGKSNYHFADTVQRYVRSHDPVVTLCFDVEDFFGSLCHAKLKSNLRQILGGKIEDDWYKVYRFVTDYHFIDLDVLKAIPDFAARMRAVAKRPIATIQELKSKGIKIQKNPKKNVGIPQGTPISASLSNLYMLEFDKEMKRSATILGALYQRYSDDILLSCAPKDEQYLCGKIVSGLQALDLSPNRDKTERCELTGYERSKFQYLGFDLGRHDALIRQHSISKQWRSMKRAFRRAERRGLEAIKAGTSNKIWVRALCSRFTHTGTKNFLSYAGRSSRELESAAIKKQVRRIGRRAQLRIAEINSRSLKGG